MLIRISNKNLAPAGYTPAYKCFFKEEKITNAELEFLRKEYPTGTILVVKDKLDNFCPFIEYDLNLNRIGEVGSLDFSEGFNPTTELSEIIQIYSLFPKTFREFKEKVKNLSKEDRFVLEKNMRVFFESSYKIGWRLTAYYKYLLKQTAEEPDEFHPSLYKDFYEKGMKIFE